MAKNRHRSRNGSSRSGYSRRRGSALPCCCPLGPFSLPATGIAITAIVFIAYRLITETARSQMLAALQVRDDTFNSTTPVSIPLPSQGLEVRTTAVLGSHPLLAHPAPLAATVSPSASVPVSVLGLRPTTIANVLPSTQPAPPMVLATNLSQQTKPLNGAPATNGTPTEPLREVPSTDLVSAVPLGAVPLETVDKNAAPANDSQVVQNPVADTVPKTVDRNYELTATEGSESTRNSDAKEDPPPMLQAGLPTPAHAENSGNYTTDAGAHGQDLGEYDTSSTTRAGLPKANANHSSVEVRKGNDILRIPRGSRITGALPEFTGVITPNGSMVRGQNVTRVSYALYKIVKLFGFTSMVDSPAGRHTEWMSPTLQRIEFDRPSFKYWGIDGNITELHAAREAIGAAASSEYRHTEVTDNPPAGVDVLFHWTDLDGSERDPRSKAYSDHIDSVIRSAQRSNATYIIFGQFPRRRGYRPAYRYGKWVFLDGAKTKPFLYNDYVRGVVPVMPNAKPYVLYMTFYSVKSLPS